MKRSKFNELNFKMYYAKGFIKPTHKFLFIAWWGFLWFTAWCWLCSILVHYLCPYLAGRESSSALSFLQRMKCTLGFRPPKFEGMFVPQCHRRLAYSWEQVAYKYFKWKTGIFSWGIVSCLEAHRGQRKSDILGSPSARLGDQWSGTNVT